MFTMKALAVQKRLAPSMALRAVLAFVAVRVIAEHHTLARASMSMPVEMNHETLARLPAEFGLEAKLKPLPEEVRAERLAARRRQARLRALALAETRRSAPKRAAPNPDSVLDEAVRHVLECGGDVGDVAALLEVDEFTAAKMVRRVRKAVA